jgi:alpha-glucuronidase
VYQLIPDFGGFLVKANSEGQPGPGDYQRTHAEGANMMADAMLPHGGIVMWRAFVYGYNQGTTDRVMKAVNEFKPLDGLFRQNVIIQIKNGPLDFQPREPYSPLFDQMYHTPMMPELQITQEYLGQSRHLVYLAPMWKEFFSSVESTLNSTRGSAIAGVANTGDDANWCGHHFSQANWYAFGRLAWNPALTSRQIAREWLQLTFTNDNRFLQPMTDVMETSHEACVNYMMPLGLHHIFKGDHHYGPEPEGNQPNFPDEWKPVWYHKADRSGIGFDRTVATGTGATAQYRAPFCDLYEHIDTCPEQLLLWFHHRPWTFILPDGQTLWQSLQSHYNAGVEAVDAYAATWQQMRPYVDERRFREVALRLQHQQENAREWRDHCIGYFRQFAE